MPLADAPDAHHERRVAAAVLHRRQDGRWVAQGGAFDCVFVGEGRPEQQLAGGRQLDPGIDPRHHHRCMLAKGGVEIAVTMREATVQIGHGRIHLVRRQLENPLDDGRGSRGPGCDYGLAAGDEEAAHDARHVGPKKHAGVSDGHAHDNLFTAAARKTALAALWRSTRGLTRRPGCD